VDPKEWNEIISREDTLVIDTRNDYEVQIGSFKNAINPKTETFRDFPAFIEEYLQIRISVPRKKINRTTPVTRRKERTLLFSAPEEFVVRRLQFICLVCNSLKRSIN
jgi:rhodanese-related sulfurtransferase